MNILVYSNNYPSPQSPQSGTFVYRLVQEFAKQNNEVTVVAVENFKFGSSNNGKSYGAELAKVIRPKTVTFSDKKIGFIDTFRLTSFSIALSSRKAIRRLDQKPDIIYCHFLTSALHFLTAFPKNDIPVFLAVGESYKLENIKRHYSDKKFSEYINKITGFVAVSSLLKKELLDFGIDENKIIVEPNGTDLSLFKERDRKAMKIKYNVPVAKKVVLFVGFFGERKGVEKVVSALDFLGEDVVGVFLGKGEQIKHPKVLFSGPVPHQTVAEYMSVADVFVLPTLSEGSSNVIVEAMASGLPIVSSNIPEIKEQCFPEFSILVNPHSVEEIANALNLILTDDTLRAKMSVQARRYAEKSSLTKRAERILSFITQKSNLKK